MKKSKIIEAMVANLAVEMTYFDSFRSSTDLRQSSRYTLVNSGLDDDTFNIVANTHCSAADCDSVITEVISYFHHKKLPFTWWVGPLDTPPDLALRLTTAGLVHSDSGVGMYLDLDAWQCTVQQSTMKIKRVIDLDGFLDFARLLKDNVEAYEKYFRDVSQIISPDSPFEYYVGYVNDVPVTRGVILYHGGVAGIYYIGTADDKRRCGYASIILQFLLQRAKELKYATAVLQASQDGLSLYKKFGFIECCMFYEYKPKFRS